jgi:hypothetical protein
MMPGSPWLSEVFRLFTARLWPQRGPNWHLEAKARLRWVRLVWG